jgi:hypothetical protein
MIENWPIVILLTINLMIGLWIVRDYGISADEPRFFEYGYQSLNAYRSWIDYQYIPSFGKDDLRYYGPVFAISTALVGSLIKIFVPRIFEADIWHYSYFVDFQITGLFLYWLANRWFTRKTSFILTALFLFQPLLWGHAFINPKDIPFLMAFTGSIALGLWAADKLPIGEFQGNVSYLHFLESWKQANFREKRIAIAGTVVWFLVLTGLFLGWGSIVNATDNLVRIMYSRENLFLARIFALFVSPSNILPIDNYILKAVIIADRIRMVSLALITLVTIFLYRPVFPFLFTWLQDGNFKGFLSRCLQFFRSPYLILAAISLGLAISTRILGPWAGILVSVYLVWRIRNNALPAIVIYAIVAIITSYLTWPYLWPNPVARFLDSLNVMATFPWQGKVLFNGIQFLASDLPQIYLPVLLSIQLTEPVLILFVIGLSIMAFQFYRKNISPGLPALFAGWFLIPILIFILTNRPMYDNFRQILFLMPPLFLVCGLAIESIIQHFNKNWMMVLVIIILLVPSVISLVPLHPYQYVYYNHLVGGTAGASGRFEMDYWVTSYAESMRYINRVAPPDSKVLVWTFAKVANEYARPGLIVASRDTKDVGNFNYALISSRGDKNLSVFPNAPVIFEVRRDGVVFSAVKMISP